MAIRWPSVQRLCGWGPICCAVAGALRAAGLWRSDNPVISALRLGRELRSVSSVWHVARGGVVTRERSGAPQFGARQLPSRQVGAGELRVPHRDHEASSGSSDQLDGGDRCFGRGSWCCDDHLHPPCLTDLGDPPLGLRQEPFISRIALDNLDVDAQGRVALGHRVSELLVGGAFFAWSESAATLCRRAMPTALSCADVASTATAVTSPSTFHAACTGSIGAHCSSDKSVL